MNNTKNTLTVDASQGLRLTCTLTGNGSGTWGITHVNEHGVTLRRMINVADISLVTILNEESIKAALNGNISAASKREMSIDPKKIVETPPDKLIAGFALDIAHDWAGNQLANKRPEIEVQSIKTGESLKILWDYSLKKWQVC